MVQKNLIWEERNFGKIEFLKNNGNEKRWDLVNWNSVESILYIFLINVFSQVRYRYTNVKENSEYKDTLRTLCANFKSVFIDSRKETRNAI